MSAAGTARTFFGVLSLAELHHTRQDALHVHFGKHKRGYLQKKAVSCGSVSVTNWKFSPQIGSLQPAAFVA
jgi:hypothetical protein